MATRGKVIRVAEWLAIVTFAVMSALPAILTTPSLNYDSSEYLATPSLTSGRFPLVPAIYYTLGGNLRAIVAFQAIFGALCWSYLAREALRTARRPYCYPVIVGVLIIGCSDYVAQWYVAILSDSLSLSLLALLLGSIASWLSHRASLARVVIVAALWAFARNTNGYVLFVFGVIALIVLLIRHRQLPALLAAATTILAGLAVVIFSGLGDLWQDPFFHVMSDRILVSNGRVSWFAAHGMPVNPTLRHMVGLDYLLGKTWRHSPALESFREWMARSGQRTYLEYAVLHPWWVISGTFGHHPTSFGVPVELGTGSLDYYGGTVSRPWLPGVVKSTFLHHRQTALFVLATCSTLLCMFRFRVLRRRPIPFLWWIAVTSAGVLYLMLDWVGDSSEIGRHMVGATVQVALGLLFMGSTALPQKRERSVETALAPALDEHSNERLTVTGLPAISSKQDEAQALHQTSFQVPRS